MLLAVDPDKDLKRYRYSLDAFVSTQGVKCAKFDASKPDRLMADGDTAFSEEIFFIAVAWVESVVHPDGVADDIGWESVSLVGSHRKSVHHQQLTCRCRRIGTNNRTFPRCQSIAFPGFWVKNDGLPVCGYLVVNDCWETDLLAYQ